MRRPTRGTMARVSTMLFATYAPHRDDCGSVGSALLPLCHVRASTLHPSMSYNDKKRYSVMERDLETAPWFHPRCALAYHRLGSVM